MATASPRTDITVPTAPTMINFVDPSQVDGLVTRTLSDGETGGRYVHIIYPELKDAPELTQTLGEEADQQLRVFNSSTQDDGPLPRPELNVDWQLTAATDKIYGVRLRTGEFTGADWANSLRTFWYDRTAERAVGSAGLVAGDAALTGLVELVQEQLQEREPAVDADAVSADTGLFDSMAFNPEGDLVVEFDDYQVGPGSLGRVAVAVPGPEVEPLLSATGRAAREAALAAPAPVTSTPRAAPTRSPEAVSSQAGSVDCTRTKCVALTFDDGPGKYTGELLDLLAEENARATFFAVGTNAAASPELLVRMRDEGHLVASHSWAHRDLSKLSSSKITDSLVRTQDAVTAAIGQTPTLVRPPYGATSRDVGTVARRLGVSLVNWDVDTMDRQEREPEVVAKRAVKGAHPGAIVLMHDIHRTTVEAVPDILKQLRGKGYAFVTVPELYGPAGMRAGRLYQSGPTASRKQPLT